MFEIKGKKNVQVKKGVDVFQKHAWLILHTFTQQSSLPLANLVGSTSEKLTDQALFRCSVNCVNP
jgi:hypothetical protein